MLKIGGEIFQNTILIKYDNDNVEKIVLDLVFPYVEVYSEKNISGKIKELVNIKKKSDDCYIVQTEDVQIEVWEWELYGYLQKIIFKKLTIKKNYLVMHGSMIKKKNTCFALLGPSGTGKTTLTYALSLMGYEVVCDDKFCINTENLNVYPFSRDIMLREGGVKVLKHVFEYVNVKRISYGGYKRYKACDIQLSAPGKTVIFMFIERVQSSGNIFRLNFVETVKRLITNSYICNNNMDEIIHNCANIGNKIAAFDVKYSTFYEIAYEINNLYKQVKEEK